MKRFFLCSAFTVLLLFGSFAATGIAQTKTPVVFFPGVYATRIQAVVQNQTVAPECPARGTFEMVGRSHFSQVCRDKLMTLVYNPQPLLPMSQRFSDQPGVTVTIPDYGTTESAPDYEPLYKFLEANGYQRKGRNVNIRVAGYDSRLTPDMRFFLPRTIALIEQTYADNGNTPVHLVGHSNGPLYAQYLLTHTSQAWKNKYIHGFTSVAGSMAGQGIWYALLFVGLNLSDWGYPADTENAISSALMHQSFPANYMTAADPAVFKDVEVVIQAGSVPYTPQDYRKLFRDAGLTLAEQVGPYYIGFVSFQEPSFFPNVDVYAEIGSGLDTMVGIGLPDLTVGQLTTGVTGIFFRPGDGGQEDITNNSIQVWENMRCFRFEFTDNPGIEHNALTRDPSVLGRLLANLQRPRSVCP